MGRLSVLLVAVLGVALALAATPAAGAGLRGRLRTLAAAEAEAEAEWPATLLEHTAIAAQKWAPEPRTRLEQLQLAQSPRSALSLGASVNQPLFAGEDSRGHEEDTAGYQRENAGRAREPVSNHFGGAHSGDVQGLPPVAAPAPRGCGKSKKAPCERKRVTDDLPKKDTPAPSPVPPPPAPPLPVKPESPDTGYPTPPPPENPLPTPPKPSCGDMCDPKTDDPLLANIPPPPLGDEAVAAAGQEGATLAKIVAKLRNREGWLRAQKLWLSKAVEAAATVRREIELAEMTKDAVATDLDELKSAQDALSIKYKADRLKWAFKDNKITLEELKKRQDAIQQAKADVAHQLRATKDEVGILENTLGPPSQQVQVAPEELEDPLKFLEDVQPEDPLA